MPSSVNTVREHLRSIHFESQAAHDKHLFHFTKNWKLFHAAFCFGKKNASQRARLRAAVTSKDVDKLSFTSRLNRIPLMQRFGIESRWM